MYIQKIDTSRLSGLVSKNAKKKSNKDSQLILRLNKEERDDFVALCKDLDTSAAREIRRFIRDFLTKHEDR